MTRVAILDDYERVATAIVDWTQLDDLEVDTFPEHIADIGELGRHLKGYEIVVAMRGRTPFPAELFAELPDMRLLATAGMKNSAIDLEAATRHGVIVSGTRGLLSPAPELAWGLILCLARHIVSEDASVRAGEWGHTVGRDMAGRTLGLLGLGRLGSRMARVGQAFEMNTIAWSPNLTEERAAVHGVERVSKQELFTRSDVLSIHMVLADSTRGIVGWDDLQLMKPGALFVNTSRGPLVCEGALIRALREGLIAGAALDVFDHEPLPVDHPLCSLPNTLLTPHLGYVTEKQFQLFYDEIYEDVTEFLAGRPIRVLNA